MPPSVDRAAATSRRDAALARLKLARWVTFLAAAGLSGGFAALVSALAPGKTLAQIHPAVTPAPATTPATPPPKIPRLQTPAELGLQAPSGAPQAAPAPAQPAPAQQAPAQQAPVQQAPAAAP